MSQSGDIISKVLNTIPRIEVVSLIFTKYKLCFLEILGVVFNTFPIFLKPF